MHIEKSPMRRIREKLQLTQAQFAAAAGVSKGHMSEVESGVTALSERIKDFLEELSIDVEAVERENNLYRRYKRRQYIEAAERAVQGEDHSQGEGG